MNDQMQLGENSKNGALGGNSNGPLREDSNGPLREDSSGPLREDSIVSLQGHGKENFNGPLDPAHLSECHSQLCHQLYWQKKFKTLLVLAR
jgi:hypothetical protein